MDSAKRLIQKAFALSIALLALTFLATVPASQAVPLKRYDGYSYNWGGYTIVVGGEVATSSSGNKYWTSTTTNPILSYTVSYVYGEWDVPQVKTGTTGLMADTSVWVGIDGYDSGTVEQLGTASDYNPSTGQASYYAWWEMYPKFSHSVKTMDVNPGDHITAHVKFLQGQSKTVEASSSQSLM